MEYADEKKNHPELISFASHNAEEEKRRCFCDEPIIHVIIK